MTYNGTVTIADPYLIEEIHGIEEGFTAYIRRDDDSPNPREDYGHADALVTLNPRDFTEPDGAGDARHDAARKVLFRWWGTGNWHAAHPNRRALTERYLRIFHDAVGLAIADCASYREWNEVLGFITRDAAEYEGITNPQAYVEGSLQEYAMWARGEVYGVTVVHEESGEEASLWGVYDTDNYIRGEVIPELIEEVRP